MTPRPPWIRRLRKIGGQVEFLACILTARLLGKLPLPGRVKKPLVRWLGIRAFLLALGNALNAPRPS